VNRKTDFPAANIHKNSAWWV